MSFRPSGAMATVGTTRLPNRRSIGMPSGAHLTRPRRPRQQGDGGPAPGFQVDASASRGYDLPMAVGEAGSGAAVRRVNRWGRKVALGSETWVVIRAWDLAADETCCARPSVIRAEIGRWCRDRWHWPAVLEMYR